jgi:hypothetical protein
MQKVTIRFVISVCPSDRMYQGDSHYTDFRDISYLGFLPFVETLRFWFNSDNYSGICLGGVKKNHRIQQLGYPASRPRLEPSICITQV